MIAAPAIPKEGPATLRVRVFRSEYLVLFLSGLYFIALAPFTPGFTSGDNFANLLSTLIPLFVVGMGQTVVLITGGIDLSVTSTIAAASITGAAVMNHLGAQAAGFPVSIPVAIGAMLLVGALVGLLNGTAITLFKMPPFMVTLTSMMFVSGLAIWVTQSRNIGNLPPAFNAIGSRTAIAFSVAAVLGVAAHFMLSRSLWGAWIYAVGHNPKTSLISGVPVGAVIVSAYVVSGIFAAIASVIYTGQAESGSPVLAQRLLLDIVGGTIIGGTSLFGGRGKVLWTLFGVLFLKLIDNSLNLLDLSYFSIMMVKGGVILLAAILDALRVRLGGE